MIFFQKYKSKFETVWIADELKIQRIASFLENNNQLIDIRQEYDVLKSVTKEIDDEPSNLEIGCLKILLGNWNCI